jgi:hypothetical protein
MQFLGMGAARYRRTRRRPAGSLGRIHRAVWDQASKITHMLTIHTTVEQNEAKAERYPWRNYALPNSTIE